MHRSDILVDVGKNRVEYLGSQELPPWRIALVDTGAETMTGGRLKRIAAHMPADEPFCMTYGDGVSDVDLRSLITFHKRTGLAATLTAVRPLGRFGATVIEGARVKSFMEKPAGDGGRINGGFFVLQPSVLDRIEGDATAWESAPLEGLARDGQLAAYIHDGFWHPMDTLRDRQYLEQLWASGAAPWKIWA